MRRPTGPLIRRRRAPAPRRRAVAVVPPFVTIAGLPRTLVAIPVVPVRPVTVTPAVVAPGRTEIIVWLQWCGRNRVGGRDSPTRPESPEAECTDDHGCGHKFRQPHRLLTPTSRPRRPNPTLGRRYSFPKSETTHTAAPSRISAIEAVSLPNGCRWCVGILRWLEGAQAA